MIKTKQELIKEAYGQYYQFVKELIDRNGWLQIDQRSLEIEYPALYNSSPFIVDGQKVRPISLSKIDNNNGWKKLNSYEDIMSLEKPFLVYTDKGKVYSYEQYAGSLGICETQEILMYKEIEKTKPNFIEND